MIRDGSEREQMSSEDNKDTFLRYFIISALKFTSESELVFMFWGLKLMHVPSVQTDVTQKAPLRIDELYNNADDSM